MTTNIDRALDALSAKQFASIRAAARFYEVDHRTLTRRVHGAQPRDIASQHRQLLTPLEEQAIVEALIDSPNRGLRPTPRRCQQMANALLQARDEPVPKLSRVWYKKFVKRHGDVLRGRASMGTEFQRCGICKQQGHNRNHCGARPVT